METTIVRQTVSSAENSPPGTKSQLAVAIAQGENAARWAGKNHVDKRTAQRWAREPEFRAAVEQIRRRALDRAVGLMARHIHSATMQVVELGKSASSEAVRLSAARAVMSDMITASKFGSIEDRMTLIEEHIRADIRNTTHAG